MPAQAVGHYIYSNGDNMEFVLRSFGVLLMVVGGLIGAFSEFSQTHTERVLTYVGLGLMCFGLITALISVTFDRSK